MFFWINNTTIWYILFETIYSREFTIAVKSCQFAAFCPGNQLRFIVHSQNVLNFIYKKLDVVV